LQRRCGVRRFPQSIDTGCTHGSVPLPAPPLHALRDANRAAAALLGIDLQVPRESVVCVGGYWQPKYSVPNRRMVEAVQMLARTEGLLLDPVYTGKIMAGLIGMAREGALRAGERVLFLHTGGLPSLHAYEPAVLGEAEMAP